MLCVERRPENKAISLASETFSGVYGLISISKVTAITQGSSYVSHVCSFI